MSDTQTILSNGQIRRGLRWFFVIQIVVRLLLGLFYGMQYPSAALTTFLFIVPPLILFLLVKWMPLIVGVLLLGAEFGFFLQIQALDFGWEAGFQLHITCVAMTTLLYEFLSVRMRIIMALAPFAGYILLFMPTLPLLEPVYQLSRVEQSAFFAANMFLSSMINMGIVLFLIKILVQRRQELEALASSRAQLVSDLSHEIKTPVAAMLTRVQVAMTETLSEPIQKLMVMLERNLRGQTRLVNRMLDYSSAGRPFASVNLIDTDLHILVWKCIEAHQPFAEEKHIQWTVTGEVRKTTDPDILSHVLNNLIANAIAHSPEHGEITFNLTEEADGAASISITDQGEGIDSELMPHLFDPFFRGDSQRDRKDQRHGLGLSIAQRAVKCLKGEITVDCPTGGGACFTVKL